MGDLVWIDSNYEVVRAVCPSCHVLNVFNRRSELGNASHISHLNVECIEENCRSSFTIGADDAGPAYRTAYRDSSEFIRAKRYGLAIMSAVQSLEMFFAHALRELWLLKPFKQGPKMPDDLAELNEGLSQLFQKTEKFPYVRMRDLFLHAATSPVPATVREGVAMVNAIPERPRTPTDEVLRCARPNLQGLLLALKACDVHELRNRIVHQRAYRPTREETDLAVDRVGALLIPLGDRLQIASDSF